MCGCITIYAAYKQQADEKKSGTSVSKICELCNDKNSKEMNKKPMKLIECQTSHNSTTGKVSKIDNSNNNEPCPYALRAIRAGIPFIVNDRKSIN